MVSIETRNPENIFIPPPVNSPIEINLDDLELAMTRDALDSLAKGNIVATHDYAHLASAESDAEEFEEFYLELENSLRQAEMEGRQPQPLLIIPVNEKRPKLISIDRTPFKGKFSPFLSMSRSPLGDEGGQDRLYYLDLRAGSESWGCIDGGIVRKLDLVSLCKPLIIALESTSWSTISPSTVRLSRQLVVGQIAVGSKAVEQVLPDMLREAYERNFIGS